MQTGECLTTSQRALKPHEPGQGSLHFSLMQAKLAGHSALRVHSGRQFGARPTYPSRQVQTGDSWMTLHCELGPHGDGMQGLTGSVTTGSPDSTDLVNCISI